MCSCSKLIIDVVGFKIMLINLYQFKLPGLANGY